ncbi:cyclin-dependent kinase 11B-like isoform X3 [Homalodisca vitripennis]|uniref:cyclin-dependent kinase 11B-like isoform X3 n=1 Tax=Homalodisca vitripennis TaxID=197043 RepID=UPI001EEA5A85|nr:cyclin-dependent kinase 11B-like isoform X3 [Homalodisca vitripennis]
MSDNGDSDIEIEDGIEEGEIKKVPTPVSKKTMSESSLSFGLKWNQSDYCCLSEDDTADSLEIKPPQAFVHKSHSSRRDKHSVSSSRRSHKSSSGGHRKGHHHSRTHREERRRHHSILLFSRDRSAKEDSVRIKDEPRRHGKSKNNQERNKDDKMKDDRYKDDRLRDEQRLRDERMREERSRDEKMRDDRNKYDEEIVTKRKEVEVRERKKSGPEKAKEKQERDLRRERLLEAERVKEVYKKDIEERRMRRANRSRSPEKFEKKEEETILSDVSLSPTPMETEDTGPDVEIINDGSEHSGKRSEPSVEEESSEDSDSSTESDQGESDESRAVSRSRSNTPIVGSNHDVDNDIELAKDTFPPYLPAIQGCRSVEEFQCLNRIEEGTYGVVYRARDKRTEEIVALKRLKMEKEKEGFPITSLREINTLLKAQHPNIVTVREIVVGSNMDKIFIVMDYVEHDLKSLMETMKHKKQVFLPAEVKCLMQQLLRAVAHLHDNWILHRDLKASNLLLSHKGILKVGDFGLAREYGSPLKAYTPIVVTLWYRAPELLLSAKEYSTPVDMWSVGCIFAEFLAMEPLFPGKSETDQLNKIFKTLGTPNDRIWPGYSKLPVVQKATFAEFPVSQIRTRFPMLTDTGVNLLNKFLTYNPTERVAAEEALKHEYFTEAPTPIDPAMFPTWPAKSELGYRKAIASPKPPSGGRDYKQLSKGPGPSKVGSDSGYVRSSSSASTSAESFLYTTSQVTSYLSKIGVDCSNCPCAQTLLRGYVSPSPLTVSSESLSGSIPISTTVSTQSSKSWSPQGPVVGWKYACELASSSSKTRTWFLVSFMSCADCCTIAFSSLADVVLTALCLSASFTMVLSTFLYVVIKRVTY